MIARKIKIASREEFKRYVMSIASGEYKPDGNEPIIYFESIESMAQALSSKNQKLRDTIREKICDH